MSTPCQGRQWPMDMPSWSLSHSEFTQLSSATSVMSAIYKTATSSGTKLIALFKQIQVSKLVNRASFSKWNKRSERRKLRVLAVVRRSQKISPRRTHASRCTGRPKFNQLEMVTTLPTDPIWWGLMHAISSYHTNRPTNTHANKHTNPQTGPITIHCAAKLSVHFNKSQNCTIPLIFSVSAKTVVYVWGVMVAWHCYLNYARV